MDYFETDGKNYFDVFESIIEVELSDKLLDLDYSVNNVVYVNIREWSWDGDSETHYEEDIYTMGIYISVWDENDDEKEFIFKSETEAIDAGFEINIEEDDHAEGECETKKEAENYAIENYSWLKKLEK